MTANGVMAQEPVIGHLQGERWSDGTVACYFDMGLTARLIGGEEPCASLLPS